ncbi:tetratricopeptide repeat protein [Fodinibius sp. Rm-B-1B1-1]|uniref:tetratricopeptide repeat protein n=1 Tax=Fodinibius alkaliphilus TaxID=3140241 RepID=UPI003159A218
MSKKQVKEELEQDVLLETFSKAQSFYDQNKNSVIGAAIALVILIGGSVGYYYYSEAQESEAQQLMGQATQAYLQGNYEEALNGSDADFTVGFEQIINNYSMTEAANLAQYYASVSAFKLGNSQEALQYIQNYEVPEGIMGVGPLSFHAAIHTELGNHAQAAELYVKAAEWDVNESTTPYNYLEAANAYHDASDKERAQEYAQKIVDEYDDSDQVTQAEQLLGMLAVAE